MRTITIFFETIKRMFYWAWTMRSSHDYDFGFTEQVLLLKLKRLRDAMNTSKYHMNLQDLYEALKDPTIEDFDRECYIANIKAHRALNVVIELLERQQDYSFYGDFSGLYNFIQNYRSDRPDALSEILDRHKHKITIPHEEYRKRLLHFREIDGRMEERDKRWAYSLIAKFSPCWWI
jgi:hypothetical protein